MNQNDYRVWIETDRPGEWLTLARPTPAMELMSVAGSTRLWTEVHTQVCVALITPGQSGVEAKWRTRARTLTARPGSLMLIEPGDVHATQAVNKPTSFDVVRFVPGVFEEAMQELGLRGEFHFRAPDSQDPDVSQVILDLVRANAEGADQFHLSALSAELVSLRLGTRVPNCIAANARNSGTISVRRSRSVGRRTTSPSKRANRSARNVPACVS